MRTALLLLAIVVSSPAGPAQTPAQLLKKADHVFLELEDMVQSAVLYREIMDHEETTESQWARAYRYVGLGLTFALAVLLFFVLGYKLDKYLGTLPIFSVVGAFLGGIGGFLHLYRAVVRDSDKKPPTR